MELCVCMSPHECGLHIHFKFPGFNCVSLAASPPLLKYLPTPLVGNPIIKILDTPLETALLLTIKLLVLTIEASKESHLPKNWFKYYDLFLLAFML